MYSAAGIFRNCDGSKLSSTGLHKSITKQSIQHVEDSAAFKGDFKGMTGANEIDCDRYYHLSPLVMYNNIYFNVCPRST